MDLHFLNCGVALFTAMFSYLHHHAVLPMHVLWTAEVDVAGVNACISASLLFQPHPAVQVLLKLGTLSVHASQVHACIALITAKRFTSLTARSSAALAVRCCAQVGPSHGQHAHPCTCSKHDVQLSCSGSSTVHHPFACTRMRMPGSHAAQPSTPSSCMPCPHLHSSTCADCTLACQPPARGELPPASALPYPAVRPGAACQVLQPRVPAAVPVDIERVAYCSTGT